MRSAVAGLLTFESYIAALDAMTGGPVKETPVVVSPDPVRVLAGGRMAVLGAATLALFPLLARNNPRLDHAWREAAYRTRATWSDFTDWLRLGR